MDQHVHPHLLHAGDGLFCLLGVVVGDPGVEGLAALHDVVKRAHRLLDRGAVVRAVVVENVHVVEVHPLQGLVDGGDEVFPGSVVAVGSLPHVVSRLGGDDQLIPVGTPVRVHMLSEVPLRLPVGRAVVVREIENRLQ